MFAPLYFWFNIYYTHPEITSQKDTRLIVVVKKVEQYPLYFAVNSFQACGCLVATSKHCSCQIEQLCETFAGCI